MLEQRAQFLHTLGVLKNFLSYISSKLILSLSLSFSLSPQEESSTSFVQYLNIQILQEYLLDTQSLPLLAWRKLPKILQAHAYFLSDLLFVFRPLKFLFFFFPSFIYLFFKRKKTSIFPFGLTCTTKMKLYEIQITKHIPAPTYIVM